MQSISEMEEDTGNLWPRFEQRTTKYVYSRREAFNLNSADGRFESSPEIPIAVISWFAQFLQTNVWVSTLNQVKTVFFPFLLEVLMKYCKTHLFDDIGHEYCQRH